MYSCTLQILCNKRVESLLIVKEREVSGGKEGLLHMRAFTVK